MKRSSRVQEKSSQGRSFLTGLLTLNKSREILTPPYEKLPEYFRSLDKVKENRRLEQSNLPIMPLLAVLEEAIANLKKDPSLENELCQSAIVMECISGRVGHIVACANSTSLMPSYIQEYMSIVSNYFSRIISLLNGTAETEIPALLRNQAESAAIETPTIQDDLHEELQKEVLHMIEAKTTPTGERYKTRTYRKDDGRKENAEEFLLRVYAKFKKSENDPFPLQGIYQDQIREIDLDLLVAINQFARVREQKTSEFLHPRSVRNDLKIANLKLDRKTISMMHTRIRKFPS